MTSMQNLSISDHWIKPICGTYMALSCTDRERMFFASDYDKIRLEVGFILQVKGGLPNGITISFPFRMALISKTSNKPMPGCTFDTIGMFGKDDEAREMTAKFLIDPKCVDQRDQYYVAVYRGSNAEPFARFGSLSFFDIKPSQVNDIFSIESFIMTCREWEDEKFRTQSLDVTDTDCFLDITDVQSTYPALKMNGRNAFISFTVRTAASCPVEHLPFKIRHIDDFGNETTFMATIDSDSLPYDGDCQESLEWSLSTIADNVDVHNPGDDSYCVLTLFNKDLAIVKCSDVHKDNTLFAKDDFQYFLAPRVIRKLKAKKTDVTPRSDDLPPIQKLDSLTGLEGVKAAVKRYVALNQYKALRSNMNLKYNETPLHTIFFGPPGTGKTTVAKILGDILREAGALSKGHVVITERARLIGEYYGSASKLTKEAINRAQGGILFIDEAYQLHKPADPKDPGHDVIGTLMTELADTSKRDWMLILAGYTQEMEDMFKMNTGLSSRIPKENRYYFKDYSVEELIEIAHRYFLSNDYVLTDEAKSKFTELVESEYEHKDKYFGNARHILNIIESEIIPSVALRVYSMDSPTSEDLTIITENDISIRDNTSVTPKIGFRI